MNRIAGLHGPKFDETLYFFVAECHSEASIPRAGSEAQDSFQGPESDC